MFSFHRQILLEECRSHAITRETQIRLRHDLRRRFTGRKSRYETEDPDIGHKV